MPFTARNNSDGTELMAFSKNNKNNAHLSHVFTNTDPGKVSPCQPCLHQPITDSTCSANGGICNADSRSNQHEPLLNGFNDSLGKPHPTFEANGSAKKTPFSKRLKSRPECFSVKYSVSESKPLISEYDNKIDNEHEKDPEILLNPHKRTSQLHRSSSLDNISVSLQHTEHRDKPLACMSYNLTALQPPKALIFSGFSADDFKGSFDIRHPQCFNHKPTCHSQVQPQQTLPTHHPAESTQPTVQSFSQPPNNLSLHLDCSHVKNSPQLMQHSNHTVCPGTVCSNNEPTCELSFAESTSDAGVATTSLPDQIPSSHSLSHQDSDIKHASDNNPCLFGSDFDTSDIENSSTPVGLFYSPQSLDAGTNSSRPSWDTKKPLHVFVPQRQTANCLSQTLLTDKGNAPSGSCRHNPSLDNSACCTYNHHPTLDPLYAFRPLHCHNHNAPNSTPTEESSAEVHGNSHAITSKDGNSHSITSKDGNIGTCRHAHPPAAHNDSPLSPFDFLHNEPTFNGYTDNYPDFTCNHNNNLGPSPCWRHNLTQIDHPDAESSRLISNIDPESAHDSHLRRINAADVPLVGQCERNQNGTISNRLSPKTTSALLIPLNQANSQQPYPSYMHDSTMTPHLNNTSNGLSNFHSNNCHAFQYISLNTAQNNRLGHHSSYNSESRNGHQQGRQHSEQHSNRIEVIDDGNNLNNMQTRDKDYKSGRMQGVTTPHVDANSDGSQRNPDRYKRQSATQSVSSSADSGHPANRDGSLQRSCKGELGYMKTGSGSSRSALCSDRDTPDYSYLCIVATVLNPLFGLAAFLCNHYARKNYQLHKLTKANNLYFATITVSTVTIFITLVGAALLVTHSVVTSSDKPISTFTPSVNSCASSFASADEYIKTFFDLDLNLYCEVSQNYKVMEALKRFYLEDSHNRKKFSKLNNKSGNITDDDTFNSTQKSVTNLDWFSDMSNEKHSNTTDFIQSQDVPEENPDLSNSVNDILAPPLPIKNDNSLHNTVLSSKNGPVVPPELEGEYQQFLKGNKWKIEDVSPVLKDPSDRPLSEQPSASTETIPPNGTTIGLTTPQVNFTSPGA